MFERLSLCSLLLAGVVAWTTLGSAIEQGVTGAAHVEAVAQGGESMPTLGWSMHAGLGASVARGAGRATRAGVETVGSVVDRAGYGLQRAGLQRMGSGVIYFLGSETLSRTSLEVAGGLTLLVPWIKLGETPLINFSYVGKYWSGHLADANAPLSGKLYRMRGVHTPVFGFAVDDAAGTMKSAQLPFVSGYIADRAYGVTVGLQNVGLLKNITSGPLGAIGALGLGHYADRAAYLGVGGGFSLAGPVGAGFGFTFFYPPLEKVVRGLQVERMASWVRRTESRIGQAVRRRLPQKLVNRFSRRGTVSANDLAPSIADLDAAKPARVHESETRVLSAPH